MKINWRRLAPAGLYITLLAIIVSTALYTIQRQWNLPLQISLAFIVIGLALFIILDPARTREILAGRQARYGSNALIMSVAFFGILLVVNYVAYKNPQRWDLTAGKQRTLTQETLDTLDRLPQPVMATAFYPSGVSTQQVQQLLDDYKFFSKGKFDYKFVDPIADPVAARAANVALETGGTIVVNMGDRQEKVSSASENEMTSAMVRLLSEKLVLYFLVGHGEYRPEATGDQSYTKLKGVLESKNYTVKELDLLSTNTIPEDARVIVVAGPRKPVTKPEMDLVKGFQEKGGALIVMEEPSIFTDYGDQADLLAQYLQTDWGIIVGQDIVVDMTSQQPFQVYAYRYADYPITNKLLDQRLGTAFPTARSIQASETFTDVNTSELIFTAPQSWAETDMQAVQSNANLTPDEGAEQIGEVPLAVAADRQTSGARVAVFGDADFAIDVNFNFLGNGDLLVNTIDWAANQESIINLTPREQVQRIMVTPTVTIVGLILFGSMILIPGLVVVAGIVVWIMRRKRG
jgi:ABC-type uncharacterized transport system involved in gliding motility auxiliary subunit